MTITRAQYDAALPLTATARAAYMRAGRRWAVGGVIVSPADDTDRAILRTAFGVA